MNQPPTDRGRRLPIRFKLLAGLVLLASLCAAVVASTLIGFFTDDKTTTVKDLGLDIASNTAASVDLLVTLHQDRLERLAETLAPATDPQGALSAHLESHDDAVYLALYDNQRQNVLSVYRGALFAQSASDLAGFLEARRRLALSPAYIRTHGLVVDNSSFGPGLLTVSLIIPCLASHSPEPYFLRVDILADRLLEVTQRAPGFTTYVVDRGGSVLAHPDPLLMASRRPISDRALLEPLLNQLGRTAAGSVEFEREDGEPVLASFATVHTGGLGVVVERPKKDAWLAANRLRLRSMRAAGMILAIAILFSVFLSRALTARLLDLSVAARRLEKGDFDAHTRPRANDELGDLARSLNLAAAGLKERDLKLKETYQQLLQSEKLAGLGRMSAGIVHEVKNPMTAILGQAELLMLTLPDDDPTTKRVDTIIQGTLRCKEILESLLRFARGNEQEFEPVHLHEIIQQLVDLMAAQLQVKQVALDCRLEARDDLIKGDANQLSQVFMNLALNASDAMEQCDSRLLTIATKQGDSGAIELCISDTGHGIPQDKLGKIFEPFFTTKAKGKGTGLGLAVSYGIVTKHGGTISVASVEGEGTRFSLSFPVAEAEPSPQSEPEIAPSSV